MIFSEFKNQGGIPILKSGVILTALIDKGLILKAALEKANLHFRKIIFVDDNLKKLESIKKICHELNINF